MRGKCPFISRLCLNYQGSEECLFCQSVEGTRRTESPRFIYHSIAACRLGWGEGRLTQKRVFAAPFSESFCFFSHLKFWGMRTDERVRSMCLHHLHVGVLPVSTHDIDLVMNTQYSGLDFKYKVCFNRLYLHACANFLSRSWSSHLKPSVFFSG